MYAELKADAVGRVTKETRKALTYYKSLDNDVVVAPHMPTLISTLIHDAEVYPEIENLVRIIIEEQNEENE